MEKTIKMALMIHFAAIFLVMGCVRAEAGVFDQKSQDTAKWSRFYGRFGRASGNYGNAPRTFSTNTAGYKNMRGQFGYGAEYTYLYSDGLKVDSIAAVMSLRPDWNLDAEPTIFVSYGTADLKGGSDSGRDGKGTMATVGLSLDLFKGPFYSTSLGLQNIYLNSDAPSVGSTSFQAVTFSVNIDLY